MNRILKRLTAGLAAVATCTSFCVLAQEGPIGRFEGKIVGGTTVTPGEYPYSARISRTGFTVWCGGALISRTWVVSAAHCFDDQTPGNYTLTLGEHNISTNEGVEQVIPIAQIIRHPSYNASTLDNDIALIELANPATLNARVSTIQIAAPPSPGTDLTVIGWGRTTEGGMISNTLQEAEIPRRTSGECDDAYPGQMTPSMFCAGDAEGGIDSCQGDSGGPISINVDGAELQVGIVSWGIGCARPDLYGVYTNVSLFRDWIADNTGVGAVRGWERLGGVILEEPECVSWGPNRIDCFARGQNAAMWHRWWNGSSWGGWEDLGGTILEAPECVSWEENRIDCFARGTDRAMYHRWWNGSSWGGWENLGGTIIDQPNCVSWGPNRIDCFARGTDRAMHHRWWDGSQWGGWESLGGVILERPECTSWAPNRIDCFARGQDHAMYHKWWNGKRWNGWESLGGQVKEEQDCISWGPNRIDCFARGTDRAMYHRWWDGSQWGGWESLGGVILERPECTSWAPNRIDCFARGQDRAMYHKWWNGSSWGGWERLGGILLDEPSCVTWSENRIDCFGRGTDSAMYHKWWDGSAWRP